MQQSLSAAETSGNSATSLDSEQKIHSGGCKDTGLTTHPNHKSSIYN